ncbi:Uu.00g013160.m01.CDS01 [Anthostomella pinea]|uniref:Uu.00g013160.m01.CDS01 n=1 Tax=Anthostomella pinea TaxID=933095 RepID=A0AAI8VY51_9PEZI|nr:Uu.00g013160.m01.CDS01 [Anthostomella pinea]
MSQYESWKPLPDPDRPNCPYFPGFKAEIKSHSPPPPFGARYYDFKPRKSVSSELLKATTQSKHVLEHPPMNTTNQSKPLTASLTVFKSLSIGNAQGAQVVACHVTPEGGGASYTAAAKIFDALYYPFALTPSQGWLTPVYPSDVTYSADAEYSREAAVYECLQSKGQTGTFAPECYGSRTFDIPLTSGGVEFSRPVRLLLMEYLDGPCLKDLYSMNTCAPQCEVSYLDAFHYDESFHLEIAAQIMDGVARQNQVIHKRGGASFAKISSLCLDHCYRPALIWLAHLPALCTLGTPRRSCGVWQKIPVPRSNYSREIQWSAGGGIASSTNSADGCRTSGLRIVALLWRSGSLIGLVATGAPCTRPYKTELAAICAQW